MLKNSERNCSAMPSRAGIRNRLLTPMSHCQKFGPRNALRPTLPNGALAVGMPKAALFQYWSIMDAPLGRVGSPTRLGRCVATPRHSARRPVASSADEGVYVTFTGKPELAELIVLSSHPPAIASIAPCQC